MGRILLAVGIGVLLVSGAIACSQGVKAAKKVGDLEIYDPFARASHEEGAVYMAFRNTGDDDSIIAASSPVANKVELHNTVALQGGGMRMTPVERIPLPKRAWVALSPGGYHIMLVDLKEELKAGQKITVTIRFERAGSVTLEVPVVELMEEGGH